MKTFFLVLLVPELLKKNTHTHRRKWRWWSRRRRRRRKIHICKTKKSYLNMTYSTEEIVDFIVNYWQKQKFPFFSFLFSLSLSLFWAFHDFQTKNEAQDGRKQTMTPPLWDKIMIVIKVVRFYLSLTKNNVCWKNNSNLKTKKMKLFNVILLLFLLFLLLLILI